MSDEDDSDYCESDDDSGEEDIDKDVSIRPAKPNPPEADTALPAVPDTASDQRATDPLNDADLISTSNKRKRQTVEGCMIFAEVLHSFRVCLIGSPPSEPPRRARKVVKRKKMFNPAVIPTALGKLTVVLDYCNAM